MRDVEVSTTDHHEATLFQYSGLPFIKCQIEGGGAVWTFRAPQFDVDAIRAEFQSTETAIYLKEWIRSFAIVLSFRNKARQSLEGVFFSDRYKEPLVRSR